MSSSPSGGLGGDSRPLRQSWSRTKRLHLPHICPGTSSIFPHPALPKLSTRIRSKASGVSKGQGEGRGQISLFQLLFSEYFRLGLVQLNPTLSVGAGHGGTDVEVYLRCLKPCCKKKGLRNKTEEGDANARSWGSKGSLRCLKDQCRKNFKR